LHPHNQRHFYQKEILKKFNFVLDMEAAKNFSAPNVDATYSWGKPDYKYTQFIHRSGILLAQITDEGDFLLLANRLYNNRSMVARESTKFEKLDVHERRGQGSLSSGVGPGFSGGAAGSDRPSPHPSPLVRATTDVLGSCFQESSIATNWVTPEQIKNEMDVLCSDAKLLERFYCDVLSKANSPGPNTPMLDMGGPILPFPPGGFREASPSPVAGLSASNSVVNINVSDSPRPSAVE
jgi:hypothetical protein